MSNNNKATPEKKNTIPDIEAMASRLKEMAANLRQTADHVDSMANELLSLRSVETALAQAQALAQHLMNFNFAPAVPTQSSTPRESETESGIGPAPETNREAEREPDAASKNPARDTVDPPEEKPEPPSEPRRGTEPEPKPETKPEPHPEPPASPDAETGESDEDETPKPEDERERANDALERMLGKTARYPSLGRRIAVVRSMKNIPASNVSSRTGIPKQTLRDIENNTATPTDQQLAKIACAVGLTREQLVNDPISKLAPVIDAETVGARITLARIRSGITQTTLAARLSVSVSTVADYESDRQKLDTFEKLASALGCEKEIFFAFLPGYVDPRKLRNDNTRDALADHDKTGEKLRKLRIKKNMSLADLAAKTGLSAQHLGRIESGVHNPHESTIEKLAIALNVTPLAIIGEQSLNIRKPYTYSSQSSSSTTAKPAAPVMTLEKKLDPAHVATVLSNARKTLNLSVTDLSATTGVNASTIIKAEGGTLPKQQTLDLLASALCLMREDLTRPS